MRGGHPSLSFFIFLNKTIDKVPFLCYNKIKEREVIAMETKWIYVSSNWMCGVGYDEYVSEDGKLCKQEWSDGYTEIFEVA
jgi:hypothetical protein